MYVIVTKTHFVCADVSGSVSCTFSSCLIFSQHANLLFSAEAMLAALQGAYFILFRVYLKKNSFGLTTNLTEDIHALSTLNIN
jgi:hypothetical protein